MVDLRQGLGWYLVAHALGVTAPPVLPAPALRALHHVCGFFPTQFVILGLEIHDPLQRGPHERFLSRHSPSFPIPCTPSLPEPHSHTPGARAAPSAGSPASRTRLSCGTYEP